MKAYVVFYESKKPICGTWVDGKSECDCLVNAEFKIMCHYPNVAYNDICVVKKCEEWFYNMKYIVKFKVGGIVFTRDCEHEYDLF